MFQIFPICGQPCRPWTRFKCKTNNKLYFNPDFPSFLWDRYSHQVPQSGKWMPSTMSLQGMKEMIFKEECSLGSLQETQIIHTVNLEQVHDECITSPSWKHTLWTSMRAFGLCTSLWAANIFLQSENWIVFGLDIVKKVKKSYIIYYICPDHWAYINFRLIWFYLFRILILSQGMNFRWGG